MKRKSSSIIMAIIFMLTFFKVGYAEPTLENENSKVSCGIKNILLIGVDGENLEKYNRSDTMIIMSIDQKNNNIKLTSLGRDTYVDIKGHGKEKLTHAYAYGGPDLLIDTINNNFGLNIERYATVNFSSFMKIIDLIGGVEVEVTENDVEALNQFIKICYNLYPQEKELELIDSAGTYNLNGYQALAFSRIRYQDSTDARNSRQRMVVKAALENLKKSGISGYIGSLNLILSGVKTNLSPTEIVILGYKVLRIGPDNMKALEFPYYKEEVRLKEAGWVVLWDKDKNLQLLDRFLYNY